MKQNHFFRIPGYVLLVFAFCLSACNRMPENLRNEYLKIEVDPDANLLKLISASGNNVVASVEIDPERLGIDRIAPADPVWGEGTGLVVRQKDGGVAQFVLYPDVPFLFATRVQKNSSADTIDIRSINGFKLKLDLGKPASALKTLGTGGLFEPDKNPGSYLFMTTADPVTRNGLVAGWLTVEKGSGVLFSAVENDRVELSARVDYGHYLLVPDGFSAPETLLLGYFDDVREGVEKYADALARQYQVSLPDRTAVYCTWYAEKNGGAGSEASTMELARFVGQNLKKYGMDVIQIDDEWQDGGRYNGPRRGFDRVKPDGPYPNGMKIAVDSITANGLRAGIWWMPFARNHQDPEYADRRFWFASRENGQPYETPWGGTSLDLTVPEVRTQIREFSKKLMEWGFNYFKMDGLWTGTVTKQVYINDGYRNDSIGNNRLLHDPMVTQIEAYRSGLRLIGETTAGKVYLSGCNVSQNMRSLGATIGLVHSMRIGPDYSHEDGIKTGPLRASRLYFLNGRVWWNDPDPAIVREAGHSAADASSKGVGDLERARMLPSFAAITGQFYLSSDWLPDLPAERLEIMKRTMASHNGQARPVDAFDRTLPEIWAVEDRSHGADRHLIGLFNWDSEAKPIGSTLNRAGLDSTQTYYAFDFWKNQVLPAVSGALSLEVNPQSMTAVALRARENRPVIVSTSQHITQGMTDLLKEEWAGDRLTVSSRLIAGDEYEVRIAGLNDGAGWTPVGVVLSDGQTGANIRMLPDSSDGWMRVVIQSAQGGEVNWEVRFKQK